MDTPDASGRSLPTGTPTRAASSQARSAIARDTVKPVERIAATLISRSLACEIPTT
jgi:hypothetical protein